jgi:DNA-binding NtrC family response regulator
VILSTKTAPSVIAAPASADSVRSGQKSSPEYSSAHESLDRELLTRVLAEERGNVVRAAKALHISRTTLYSKARKLGVRLPSRRDPQ